MITNAREIMSRVEECILEVGLEFNKSGGDARFWNEADIRHALLAALWRKEGLTIDVSCMKSPSGGLPCFKVPLAHSERAGKGGSRPDIVVYDIDTATHVVRDFMPYPYWAKELRECQKLAVLEIKQPWVHVARCTPLTTPEALQGDLRKIRDAVGDSQQAYGYALVFATTASLGRKPREYAGIALVRQAAADLTAWKTEAFQGNPNCGVFWASDHPDDPPRFL